MNPKRNFFEYIVSLIEPCQKLNYYIDNHQEIFNQKHALVQINRNFAFLKSRVMSGDLFEFINSDWEHNRGYDIHDYKTDIG